MGEGCLGVQPDIGVGCAESLGTEPDLLGALLGGDVQRPARPTRDDLEQQGALADAGLATEQGDGAGDQATSEDTIEFVDARGFGAACRDIDVGEGRRPGARRRWDRHRVWSGDLLFEGVPAAAAVASSRPPGVVGPTLDAHVGGASFGVAVGKGCRHGRDDEEGV